MKALPALACALLLSACGGKEKETEWGVYNEPVERTELPQSAGVRELTVNWNRDIGDSGEDGYAIIRPAIGNGGIFVANRAGDVLRLDPADGKVVWRRDLDHSIYTGVGLGEGLVFAGLDDGTLVALDAGSGEPQWESSIRRQISAIPVAGSGRVIVRTADGMVIGIDPSDGDQVWSVQRTVPGLSLHGDSKPLVSGDTVITGMANGRIMANAVVNGRDFWETDLSFVGGTNELEQLTDIDASPVLQGAGLYAATYQGDVVAVDIQTSSIRWRRAVSTRLPLEVDGDALFVTGALGDVVALATSDGEVLWETDIFRGRGMSNPVALAERVVVGDADGNLYLLAREDGSLLQTSRIDRGAVVSLIGLGDSLLAFTADGAVVMVGTDDN